MHKSVTSSSGVNTGSSDQNKGMEFDRKICYFDDCNKIYHWFVARIPSIFMMKSLSTGVVAVHGKDAVNCDEAEIIGSKIQESLDKVNFTDAHIKKKDQFVILQEVSRLMGNIS